MLLEKKLIERLINASLSRGADFAEVFVESTLSTTLQSLSGRLEKVSSNKSFGVGIRIAKKFNTVYGYTNSNNPKDLLKLADDLSKSFNDDKLTKSIPLNDLEVGSNISLVNYCFELSLPFRNDLRDALKNHLSKVLLGEGTDDI